ncbi:MAG TPA: cytochrome P450 [Solirubrobacteraceae bacterium]|nr:cytochrome P450 [Solirubrobacteraceae bacterium]
MPLPPGPRLPSPLQVVGFFRRPTGFMERCQRRYGDVFTLRMPASEPMVFLADPDLVKAVWTRDKVNGLPAGRRITLQPVMGPRSVLLQEGAEHLRRRRLMLPPFHGERMRRYGELMDEITLRDVERWPVDRPFALMPRMQSITRDVILRAVFGTQPGPREDELRRRIDDVLVRTTRAPTQVAVLLSEASGIRRTPFHRAVRRMDDVLREEIRERQAAADLDARADVLSMLVAARDEDGEPLDEDELRDQLVTLLLAGHETTATALAWAFDALFRNPEVLARIEASLAGGDEYLDAVVEETLRIRPTIHDVGRRLGEALETKDSLTVDAGTAVFASVHLLHRREDLFPDPLAFRPERFLGDDRPSTYAWIPFGGGMRRCLGAAFAQFEMRRVLRTILERADLRPATNRAEPLERRPVTVVPRHGTPAVLAARR